MTNSGEKLRALVLAALMVFSVFGGTVALSGVGAAANSISGGADSTGAITNGALTPSTVAEETTTNNHIVNVTVTGVDADGNEDTLYVTFPNEIANLTLSPNSEQIENGSGVSVSDSSSLSKVDGPDGDGVQDTLTVGVQRSYGGTEDLEFQFDVTTETPNVDGNTTFDIGASFMDSNGSTVATASAATLTVTDTDGSGSAVLKNDAGTTTTTFDTVGDTVTAEIDVPSGTDVKVENVLVDGGTETVVQTKSAEANSVVSFDLNAVKDGEVRFYTDGSLSTTIQYTSTNYKVVVPDDVLYGTTSTIEGDIFEYYAGSGSSDNVLEDDVNIDYAVYPPANATNVANPNEAIDTGDTSDGEFISRKTFDAKVPATNRQDEALDYPESPNGDGVPAYRVFVHPDPNEDNSPRPNASDNNGSTTFDVRLDLSVETDPSTVRFDDSADVTGSIVDGAGNAVSSYKFEVRSTDVEPNTGAAPTKVKGSTTAGDGTFGFTVTFNDAAEWAYGTNVGNDTNGDATINATDSTFIKYGNITVDSTDATVELTTDGGNLQNFEETYTVNVTKDGESLNLTDPSEGTTVGTDTVEGYVKVMGPFDEDPTTLNSSNADVVRAVGTNESVNGPVAPANANSTLFVHVADVGDDDNGTASFDATPIGSSVKASVENINVSATGALGPTALDGVTIYGGAEELTIDTPGTYPDYVGSDSATVDEAGPVNIIDEAVEDPQIDNAANATDNSVPYSNIFEDDGSPVVDVLPHAQTTGERINSTTEARLGFDGNRNLDGITAYRVSFELRNEENVAIVPGTTAGNFSSIDIRGASINGTISYDGGASTTTGDVDLAVDSENDNILDAEFSDVDADGDREYAFLLRPTETEDQDAQIVHEINVNGEDPVTLPLDAEGLDIDRFEVDGQEVDTVAADQEINITAVVEAPYDNNAPVNNGRVRLTQNGTQVGQIDARTANVNDGEYSFDNIQIGDRGFDSAGDNDGVGEDTSLLTFTAYQYADANPQDQVLARNEVDKAAVEKLNVQLDDSLQIEYLPEMTSQYSGDVNGTFTLTKGVEYQQIGFKLTDEAGNPVNLTQGLNDTQVGDLNELSHPSTLGGDASDNPVLVTLESDTGGEVRVHFNNTASDPANGTYVIDDVQQMTNDTVDLDGNGTIEADEQFTLVNSESGGYSNSDAFVFDSLVYDDETQYTLSIETPDRSRATANDTGQFVAAQAQFSTTVVGEAGDGVPNSTQDSNDAGTDVFDDTTRDQSANLNNNTADVDTPTITDRMYRVNVTVEDATGTPLNASDFGRIQVTRNGFQDRVNPGTAPNDIGSYGIVSGSGTNQIGPNTVRVQNDRGVFQYDLEGETGGDDGILTGQFSIDADDSDGGGATGTSDINDDVARNPIVEVYGENGGDLPVDQDTGNQILANGITQQLRVEAFPADTDDFVLPDGQTFRFVGPVSETTVATTTKLNSSFADTQLATPGFSEGQIGFIGEITPTGTGDGIIGVRDSAFSPVFDTEGNRIVFDVLRSNRELNVERSPQSVNVGESVTLTFTDQSTGQPVEDVTVTVESPQGDTTTLLTDAAGVATINSSFVDEGGEYGISTRRAGFAPLDTSFSAAGAAGPQVSITGATLEPNEASDNTTVTHTLTLDVSNVSDDGNTDTFTVNFPGAVENISPNSVSVEDAEGDTVAVTGADTSGTLYEFSVSPDSSADTRDLTATVSVDVTFPDVDQNTTASITASVSDSSTGSDSASVDVTILNVTEEEPTERPDPVGGSQNAPLDPDNDGVYEDVNGDGQVLPGDATVLFNAVFEGEIPSDDARFDINDDGSTLPGDATVLFEAAFNNETP